jgi:hypothetical protein
VDPRLIEEERERERERERESIYIDKSRDEDIFFRDYLYILSQFR